MFRGLDTKGKLRNMFLERMETELMSNRDEESTLRVAEDVLNGLCDEIELRVRDIMTDLPNVKDLSELGEVYDKAQSLINDLW